MCVTQAPSNVCDRSQERLGKAFARYWRSEYLPKQLGSLPLWPTLCAHPHHVLLLPRSPPCAASCPLLPDDPTFWPQRRLLSYTWWFGVCICLAFNRFSLGDDRSAWKLLLAEVNGRQLLTSGVLRFRQEPISHPELLFRHWHWFNFLPVHRSPVLMFICSVIPLGFVLIATNHISFRHLASLFIYLFLDSLADDKNKW